MTTSPLDSSILQTIYSNFEYDFGTAEHKIDKFRNVFVRDMISNKVVAGLIQRGDVSVATYYRWLDMILVVEGVWFLSNDADCSTILQRDDTSILPKGIYNIVNLGGIALSSRPVDIPRIRRLFSPGRKTPDTVADEEFTNIVNTRDGACCVTKLPYPPHPDGGQICPAARIFPLAHYREWASMDYVNDTFQCDHENFKFISLLSPKNGITLSVDAQHMFDSYQIAFDVDEDYRIVELSPNTYDMKMIPKLIRNESAALDQQPSDVLLREHFRQALLRFVLGDGNYFDEWDYHADNLYSGSEASIDLSDSTWCAGIGKEILERYLAMRLYCCLPCILGQEKYNNREGLRWSSRRRRTLSEIGTPPEQDWPSSFSSDDEVDGYLSNPFTFTKDPQWIFLNQEGMNPYRYVPPAPYISPSVRVGDPEWIAIMEEHEKRAAALREQLYIDMKKFYYD